VNFTREPIIETVITPRDGCKLVVRNSKGSNQEDYLVDAIEVVSFGHSFFFRSQERPKSFLVPITDYEIFESKEPRLALKNASPDRAIKISGGRESSPRAPREMSHPEQDKETSLEERSAPSDRPSDRKRERPRRRSRRGRDRNEPYTQQAPSEAIPGGHEEGSLSASHEPAADKTHPVEEPKAPSFISKLFPPPTMLIKETLGRYKLPDPSPEDLFPLAPEEPGASQEKQPFDDSFSEPPFSSGNENDFQEDQDSEE